MSLEDKVNDKQSGSLVKKALKLGWNAGLAGATTALSLATYGTTGVYIGAGLGIGSFLGSAVKKSKSLYANIVDSLKTYSTLNLIATPVLRTWDYVIPLVPGSGMLGGIGRGLFASTAFNAFFEAMYKGGKHLIDNYFNPVGMVKSIKHNYFNEWKRSSPLFSPAYFAATNGMANIAGIPTFAYNALGLSFYNQMRPIPSGK